MGQPRTPEGLGGPRRRPPSGRVDRLPAGPRRPARPRAHIVGRRGSGGGVGGLQRMGPGRARRPRGVRARGRHAHGPLLGRGGHRHDRHTDVFLHTWDLARATGLDERLDPEEVHRLYEGMEPMDEVPRGSGHYGPRVEVPDDADEQTRLIAFIGRRP
ncbi:MAG: hypothetical protein WKG07_45885 [Hymenobacter sp.]